MPKLPMQDAVVTHKLRPEHVEQMKQLTFLLSYLQQQVQQVQNQQAMILQIGYGVDVAKGEWHLDLENGVVSRGNPEQ